MGREPILSPDARRAAVAEAVRLRGPAGGRVAWPEIARRLGVRKKTLLRWCRDELGTCRFVPPKSCAGAAEARRADLRSAAAESLAIRRSGAFAGGLSLTARFFGDPAPERSALAGRLPPCADELRPGRGGDQSPPARVSLPRLRCLETGEPA